MNKETLLSMGFTFAEVPHLRGGQKLVRVNHPSGHTSIYFSMEEAVNRQFIGVDMGGYTLYYVRVL